MADNKEANTTKKQQQQQPPPPPQQQPQQISPTPNDESTEPPPPPQGAVVGGAQFIGSAPLYIPSGATSTSPFDPHPQFEPVNPKRPRFGVGQWKVLVSPPKTKPQTLTPTPTPTPTSAPTQVIGHHQTESSPSPTTHTTPNPPYPAANTTASSSDTASSPTHSPIRSASLASGLDTTKAEGEQYQTQQHHQFRKGKYVSPVWKPHEMLWLARAWRIQYQGGGGDGSESSSTAAPIISSGSGDVSAAVPSTRGKTRAEKDREVAEFLNRHGVNRDSKTAGTKWDNMLGEFRKVYEWERGGERDQIGKSYFRLSPYERKIHRLPASFDEEVFEELSQFMGARMRTSSQGRISSSAAIIGLGGDDARGATRPLALPPPPPFKDDDIPLSARTKQIMLTSGLEAYYHGGRGGGSFLGLEPSSSLDVGVPSTIRRIGKIRMTWEESVSLWAEEGEHHRGRVKLHGSMSFLNADELTFFDDSMVACTMEAFEDGPFKGFSVDKFLPGQQLKVFGRRKSTSSTVTSSSGLTERAVQLPLMEPSVRSIPPWEYQDPTEYYLGCLRVPPNSLPSLFELSWYLQEPPPEDFLFPLRKDVYRDLPQGKELFFTTTHEHLDSRSIIFDIVSSITRPNPVISSSTATSRDSYISLWDDCINRVVAKFCSIEMVIVRKPSAATPEAVALQDQWPNVTGFLRNFCLWRGEEIDQLRDGQMDPSSSLVEKLLWTYTDLPYILGYYAVGFNVTFCALSRSQDRVIRTDLYSLDLSSPTERLKALVPCYRVAGLLALLADRCFHNVSMSTSFGNYKLLPFSDFERIDLGNGNFMEMTPNTVARFFSSRRKWAAVKEIYDFLDHRIPHAEFVYRTVERDSALVFKPRGCKARPANMEQLVEALMYVTKALVALHDMSFMHRDLCWDKVMRNEREGEWFVCGFEEAAGAPQIYPHGGGGGGGAGDGRGQQHAPEMSRGLHGVKVDVWGVGYLVKSCGLGGGGGCGGGGGGGGGGVSKMLRELQNRCLDQNPEHRPTAADCYHHLLQLQSSLSAAAAGSGSAGY